MNYFLKVLYYTERYSNWNKNCTYCWLFLVIELTQIGCLWIFLSERFETLTQNVLWHTGIIYSRLSRATILAVNQFIVGLCHFTGFVGVRRRNIWTWLKCTHRLWISGRRTYVSLTLTWVLFFFNALAVGFGMCFLSEQLAEPVNFLLLTFLHLYLLLDRSLGDFSDNRNIFELAVCFVFHRSSPARFRCQVQREGLVIFLNDGLATNCAKANKKAVIGI